MIIKGKQNICKARIDIQIHRAGTTPPARLPDPYSHQITV